jgi:hypothetical protein
MDTSFDCLFPRAIVIFHKTTQKLSTIIIIKNTSGGSRYHTINQQVCHGMAKVVCTNSSNEDFCFHHLAGTYHDRSQDDLELIFLQKKQSSMSDLLKKHF